MFIRLATGYESDSHLRTSAKNNYQVPTSVSGIKVIKETELIS